ncbi:similar to galactoside O-acetyltransferase [Bacteroides sp. CAG:1060]|nr:similar to galactoside O-acetyltransferase [Bacteroides sp. CAG:1060]
MFGPNVEIHSGNHRFDIVGKYMFDISFDQKRPEDDLDVVIGDDVWIGAKCIILNGVHIGEGSIIGAGTVVSKDVPPYSILTGSRPLALRKRFSEEEIIEHKKQLK